MKNIRQGQANKNKKNAPYEISIQNPIATTTNNIQEEREREKPYHGHHH